MVKSGESGYRVGDLIRVVKIPSDLHDAAGIGTPDVFRRALGRTFRIEGFDKYGHLELVVAERKASEDRYTSDTIWIEPGFVEKVNEI
jgi:hypothetical protein